MIERSSPLAATARPVLSVDARSDRSARRSTPLRWNGLADFVSERYRWLLLGLPVYALVTLGRSGWPLAAGLTMAVVLYNTSLTAAARRWPAWVAQRTLYLRCIDIGLACIGLSLVYLNEHGLHNYQLYYDGFYAVFVALAGVSAGRKGALWSAIVATLAVVTGQIMAAPAEPVILTQAGGDYWLSVLLYSGVFGLFFLAIGLLADFAADLDSHIGVARQLDQLAGQFTALGDAVLVVLPDGRIHSANAAAAQMFDAGSADLQGRSLDTLIQLDALKAGDGETHRQPPSLGRPLPVQAHRTGGDEFPAEVTVSRYDLGDERHASVVIIRDLSDRAHVLRVAEQRERLASVGELAASIMHEISNPITGIASLAESLLAENGTGPTADGEALEMIFSEAERAGHLLRDLLRFSRREDGVPVTSLHEAVTGALALRELLGLPENVELVRELADESLWVSVGANRLRQVVLNLVENGEHAVTQCGGGRITMRTCRRGDRCVLEVGDTGSGIPADIRDRIFEPFFTTKDPGTGTGLGLSVVRSIVHDCGGEIRVRSEDGKGTTFAVTLPLNAPPQKHVPPAGSPDHGT